MNWRVIALLCLLIVALVAISMLMRWQTQPPRLPIGPSEKGGKPAAPAPEKPSAPAEVGGGHAHGEGH